MCFFGQNNLQLVQVFLAPSITLTLFQSTPMYNGPSACERCALSICWTFSNLLILFKAWSAFSLFIIINNKEIFRSILRLINSCFFTYINNKKSDSATSHSTLKA